MVKRFILSIDLGGTNLKIGLVDLKYKVKDKEILKTKSHESKVELINAIIKSVYSIIARNKLKLSDIAGLGLGLPGPIDVEKGVVHFFPNIPGWKEVKLRSILQKKLKFPVVLDNDANLMSLAEYKLGAAKGSLNAICLTLGTGVGAGVIINGSLYRASTFAAGEIGHIPINVKGPRCNCGGIACVEAYIGNKRIERLARKIFKRSITLEETSVLAKRKDKRALRLWGQVGTNLGTALVGVVNLLNPDCVVIGGGVAKAGKILFDNVKEIVKNQAMPIQAKHVKILRAKLGGDAGLIGAAILVKEGV